MIQYVVAFIGIAFISCTPLSSSGLAGCGGGSCGVSSGAHSSCGSHGGTVAGTGGSSSCSNGSCGVATHNSGTVSGANTSCGEHSSCGAGGCGVTGSQSAPTYDNQSIGTVSSLTNGATTQIGGETWYYVASEGGYVKADIYSSITGGSVGALSQLAHTTEPQQYQPQQYQPQHQPNTSPQVSAANCRVVAYTASDCGPCQQAKPHFSSLNSSLGGIVQTVNKNSYREGGSPTGQFPALTVNGQTVSVYSSASTIRQMCGIR